MNEWFILSILGGWFVLELFHASRPEGRLQHWNWLGQFSVWGMFTVGADSESQDFEEQGAAIIEFCDGDDNDSWKVGFPVQVGAPFWYRIFNPQAYLRDLMTGALEGAADVAKFRGIQEGEYAPLRSAMLMVESRYPRPEQGNRVYRLVRREGELTTLIWPEKKR